MKCGYKITYTDPSKKQRHPMRKKGSNMVTGILLFLFCASVILQAVYILKTQQPLIPVFALDELSESVQQGASIPEALVSFFRNIRNEISQ